MNLQLIPTEELLEELRNRFGAIIFRGIQISPKGDDDDIYINDWNGGSDLCIGMCIKLQKDIMDNAYYEDNE